MAHIALNIVQGGQRSLVLLQRQLLVVILLLGQHDAVLAEPPEPKRASVDVICVRTARELFDLADYFVGPLLFLKAPLISVQRYMEKENLTEGAEFTKRLEPTGLTFEWR
jgi:hypothetical protein